MLVRRLCLLAFGERLLIKASSAVPSERRAFVQYIIFSNEK
jgi:hypothetical protein